MKVDSTQRLRSLRGYEAMNMIRTGQIQKVEKGDIQAQVEFVSQIFGVVAPVCFNRAGFLVLIKFLQQNQY